ncbi:MAG: hypothetical protein H0V09_04985 [Gemmatimonadetes bacterium]|nr:hypothetical protein [Gemmatimonadota bacterium]
MPPGGRWGTWYAAALAFAAACGLAGMAQAFRGPYVVQDDARQHVFWMARYLDPGLFPGDPIADYFQSIAPPGYAALYRAAATIGLEPLLASKLLPPLLGLAAAGFAFALVRRLLPDPVAAFLASVLLSAAIWSNDDLASGTPRAFAVPLLTAFLLVLVRRSAVGILAVIALQGLFYPQVLLVSGATLLLWLVHIERGRPRLSKARPDLALVAGALAVAVAMLLLFRSRSHGYGPILSAGAARRLPELVRGGRSEFFDVGFPGFWLTGDGSGLAPDLFGRGGLQPALLIALLAALGLPWAAHGSVHLRTGSMGLLARLGAASAGLFFAAHAVLFRLHLPSRYTTYSLRVGLAVAGGLALALARHRLGPKLSGSRSPAGRRSARVVVDAAFVGIPTLLSALVLLKPDLGYVTGEAPAVYRHLTGQAPDARVASLSLEASNLPAFSRRAVLVSREHAQPYHTGYYEPFRRRARALLRAHYARDPAVLRRFLRHRRVDFLLVDRGAFDPAYLRGESWFSQFRPLSTRLATQLERGEPPALQREMSGSCRTVETAAVVLLDARCIAAGTPRPNRRVPAPAASRDFGPAAPIRAAIPPRGRTSGRRAPCRAGSAAWPERKRPVRAPRGRSAASSAAPPARARAGARRRAPAGIRATS